MGTIFHGISGNVSLTWQGYGCYFIGWCMTGKSTEQPSPFLTVQLSARLSGEIHLSSPSLTKEKRNGKKIETSLSLHFILKLSLQILNRGIYICLPLWPV